MTFETRRRQLAKRWALTDEVVLVYGGAPAPLPGTDQFHPFVPHPDLIHLTGCAAPNLVLAYAGPAHGGEGTWQLFGRRPTQEEMIWEQPPSLPTDLPLAELTELAGWLAARGVTDAKGTPLVALGANAVQELTTLLPTTMLPLFSPAPEEAALSEAVAGALSEAVAGALVDQRVVKDAHALDCLRAAAACSLAGFDWLWANAAPGTNERSLRAGMEAEFLRAGAPRTAYDSIVASGPNAAVLHYAPDAADALAPAGREIVAGDLLLVDAGARVGGYASDVTRTVVVGADPTDEQEFVWRLVLATQTRAVDRCRPGEQWRDVHLDSARAIGAGLVELGVLRGEPDALVDSGAVALFYPHGLGHLIGLAVHDVGGRPPGTRRSEHPQLRWLRTDRPLETGMVTSVEPGVYFIEALLGDQKTRERFAEEVAWERVDELRGFGGVRIEDDVAVTDDEPEVLSAAIAKPLRVG